MTGGNMKKSHSILDMVFQCEDCGAEFNNRRNGQALGAKHAKNMKHKVYGEVTIGFIYDGRPTHTPL